MLQTIGSDMECFGMRKDGTHVAMCGRIGGTKTEPLQLEHLPRGFMIQEDNVSLEFNIPVCDSRRAFVESMGIMRGEITQIMSGFGLVLSPNSSMSFSNSELQHPNALVFGCEPDFDAWKKAENNKPTAKDKNLRTCGGHIHIGSDTNMVDGVKYMDLFLGVPSILIDTSPASHARRELYGRAGATRPKPYGWEYRVLSNFWMFSDSLVGWVYSQSKRACQKQPKMSASLGKLIQICINTADTTIAQKLVEEFSIELPTA